MAETWVLNDVLVITGTVVEYMEIGFTSNAKEWTGISIDSGVVTYVGTTDSIEAYQEERPRRWLDQAYRTITFDTAPTGNLLTWLQANGVKQGKHTNKVVVNDETILDLTQDTVTPATLAKGVTAHDKSGAQITGTLRGYDTSDATVTAGDMARNVIAYGKDGKVTGNVKTVASGGYMQFIPKNNSVAQSADDALVVIAPVSSAVLFRAGSKIRSLAKLSDLGNATAADVAKGKTFTSVAGLKVTGTAEGSSAADVTFELYNNGFNNLAVVYMSKTDGVMQTTIPNSDHMPITTSEGSMVALVNQDFNGNTINLIPDNGVSIAQGWRTANVTLFVAGAETNGMTIDVEIV